MSLSRFLQKAVGCSLALLVPGVVWGRSDFTPQAGEYPVAGSLAGDQVHPHLSVAPTGGYLVWEDNITDGYGLGISAVRLDSSFSSAFAPFRVNVSAAGEQERPQVAMLANGGAAFVWQGGQRSSQHIYARFLSGANTWVGTNDLRVDSGAVQSQLNPVITSLAGGNVLVAWGSFNQAAADSLQDVYAQILSPTGSKVGGEFRINQFTSYNQRTPAVAGLSDGRFVVTWISEQQRADLAVNVYARVFNANGTPAGNEFLVDTTTNVCANPSVAAGPAGTFVITWGQKDLSVKTNGWDVFARAYSAVGVGAPVQMLNTFIFGDQFAPRIGALPTGYFVVWTSMGQDGSWEGVYGRYLDSTGVISDAEFRVNSTTASRQMNGMVTSDGSGRFVAAWSGFTGAQNGMDLFAQRFVDSSQPLAPMNAPFVFVPFVLVNKVYQPEIQVSWLAQAGLSIDHYELYVDGSPINLSTNIWLMTGANGLTVNSTHSFQVDYVTTSGRRSPLSPATTAATWSGNNSWGGIPADWMAAHYGSDILNWPSPNAAIAPSGPTLLQLFLSGSNPLDPTSWLRTELVHTPQGYFLSWNPQPGLIYQVQSSDDLSAWTNVGAPRFAAGALDSVFVGGNNTAYYRIVKLQ
ncbi:MAG TPA: hypothetical protein VL361_06150 [Candidatus Limnocylindrales bacterium]|nr:hypothetical protein [Candidatus Limnocylindrales bacterium]